MGRRRRKKNNSGSKKTVQISSQKIKFVTNIHQSLEQGADGSLLVDLLVALSLNRNNELSSRTAAIVQSELISNLEHIMTITFDTNPNTFNNKNRAGLIDHHREMIFILSRVDLLSIINVPNHDNRINLLPYDCKKVSNVSTTTTTIKRQPKTKKSKSVHQKNSDSKISEQRSSRPEQGADNSPLVVNELSQNTETKKINNELLSPGTSAAVGQSQQIPNLPPDQPTKRNINNDATTTNNSNNNFNNDCSAPFINFQILDSLRDVIVKFGNNGQLNVTCEEINWDLAKAAIHKLICSLSNHDGGIPISTRAFRAYHNGKSKYLLVDDRIEANIVCVGLVTKNDISTNQAMLVEEIGIQARWRERDCEMLQHIHVVMQNDGENNYFLVNMANCYTLRTQCCSYQRYKTIVPNNDYIPATIYEKIDFTSPKRATQELLMALFSRKDLGTRSLTGRSLVPFKEPTKAKLDEDKIEKIVLAVTFNCNVSVESVHEFIRHKCAVERKMFRSIEEKKKKKKK